MRGYFAGVTATLVQSPPSSAVYFATYEYAKAFGFWATGGRNEHLVYFTAGAMSELFASLVFVPLEVVKSRMQLGANPARATGGVVASETNFPTIRSALAGIYSERGMAGLTAGWKSGFVQDMVFSATQFLVYESLKRYYETSNERDRRSEREQQRERERERGARMRANLGTGTGAFGSAAELEQHMDHKHAHHQHVHSDRGGDKGSGMNVQQTLIAGSVSGGLAAAITNPLDVVTSRLMVQDAKKGYGTGMVSVWRATVKEGPGALWRGTIPRVAQTAPLSALSFAVYEGMRKWFKAARLDDTENPFASG